MSDGTATQESIKVNLTLFGEGNARYLGLYVTPRPKTCSRYDASCFCLRNFNFDDKIRGRISFLICSIR